MLEFRTVKHAASGRWPEILQSHAVPYESLTGKHVPCPGCGGRDRFRFVQNNPSGKWFCGQGGAPTGGDGFDLLCHVFGWSKSEALHAVADYLGIKPDASPEARQRARDLAILANARPLEEALLHELTILITVLSPRVAGHELAHNRKIKQSHTEYKAPPESHWQREETAARRVTQLIHKLYPVKVLERAA